MSTNTPGSPNVSQGQTVSEKVDAVLRGTPESKRLKKPEVGDIVHADILEGEIVGGDAAGLDPRIKLQGIGLTPLRDVYDKDELTESAKPDDTTWAARIIEVPDEDTR